MLMKRTDQLQDMKPDILASQATLVTGLVLIIQATPDMDLAILDTLATLDMDLVIPVTYIQHLALATRAIFIQAMDLVILDTQVIQDTDLVILATQATQDMDQDILGTQATLDMDLATLDIQATLDM